MAGRMCLQVAAALKAEKLILMTDVPGVMRDKDDVSTKFTELDIRDTRQLVSEGVIAGGMIPKVIMAGCRYPRMQKCTVVAWHGRLICCRLAVRRQRQTKARSWKRVDCAQVECCIRCLAQGVRATHIIDGRQPHSLLMELLTDEGVGTMIVGSHKRAEHV